MFFCIIALVTSSAWKKSELEKLPMIEGSHHSHTPLEVFVYILLPETNGVSLEAGI